MLSVGRLAADVAGEQVELVGRHEELVARVAALVGRVLDHEELARRLHRVAAAGRHLALHELDELADAVGLVHDEVAGLELQRVDDVLAPARELLDLARVVARGAAEELGLAEQRELGLRQLEALVDGCLQQVGDARLRRSRRERVDLAAGQLVLGEHVGRALDEPRALGDDRHGPAVAQQRADVIDGALGLAGEARHRGGVDAHVVVDAGHQIGIGEVILGRAAVERRERPPRAVARGLAQRRRA